jgi:hypothetical protein
MTRRMDASWQTLLRIETDGAPAIAGRVRAFALAPFGEGSTGLAATASAGTPGNEGIRK